MRHSLSSKGSEHFSFTERLRLVIVCICGICFCLISLSHYINFITTGFMGFVVDVVVVVAAAVHSCILEPGRVPGTQ